MRSNDGTGLGTAKSHGRIRPFSIGVLTFGVIALLSLALILRGGEHPLRQTSNLPVCELLGEEVWTSLSHPASDAIVRIPAGSSIESHTCALELDPVPADDRWARVARGADAGKVRQIARIMVLTQADLWQQSPNISTDEYWETFAKELVASGWTEQLVEGPWKRGGQYLSSYSGTALLLEDDGIVIWITAPEIGSEYLTGFAEAVVLKLRNP